MDKARNIAKSGWHPPGKMGGKESWRGDNKGINQVAGWIGKGKDTSHTQQAKEHSSRPLASLKDPSAFGPPPKNLNYHGGAAVPNNMTPDRSGLGVPLSTQEIQEKQAEEEEERRKPAPPPVPYRANTTGINTQNLPKPPVRRTGVDSPVQSPNPSTPSTKPKPSLPPRLPPRQNSHPGDNAPEPPPSYTAVTQQQQQQQPGAQEGYLNQSALGRLGRAGISIPAFGTGQQTHSPTTASPGQPTNPWSGEQPPSPPPSTNPHPSLSSRFAKLSTASSPPPTAPTGGTSLQQKQDALRTAQQLRADPSSVSLSDARTTASTANNIRERHGEQVAAGGKWAQGMNTKYGIANKVGSYTGGQGASTTPQQSMPVQNSAPPAASPWANEPSQGMGAGVGAFKKAPPPPVPAARSAGVGSPAPPPPVPVGSKPRT
ncbi:hypothetical protein MMC21_004930 [Puttea exsequens]|nr:hypothetical protein [Puttea exsequens]